MRKMLLLPVLSMVVAAVWCVSPLTGQEVKPEKDYGKAKILLSDAKRAAQIGSEASALEKYGEALIMLKRIGQKDPSWKSGEVSSAIAAAEAGYIRTQTSMVIKLQNVALQRKEIAKQQGEMIKKINTLVKKNTEIMKFLLENRDLIEKIEASLGS